jgi:UPF0271 protein
MSHGELTIDLNCDVGELPRLHDDGTEEALMQQISSANIACGGHAGSPESMQALVSLAMKYGVAVGAHVSYPDRPNFGRKTVAMSVESLEEAVYSQIILLSGVASNSGVRLRHVKPHGALYHDAQRNDSIAAAIAKAARNWEPSLILVEQALSPALTFWSQMGIRTVAEAFADRVYENDGKLRSRDLPKALITNPAMAAEQALGIARDRTVVTPEGSRLRLDADTICIHGDTPGAADNARAVRSVLRAAGVKVESATARTPTS